MADPEQIHLLQQGPDAWNRWRAHDICKPSQERSTPIDLSNADLSGANLGGVDLFFANLQGTFLSLANLEQANLNGANLEQANLSGANLSGANLSGAHLEGADMSGAKLNGASLSKAYLSGANLSRADLNSANLSQTICQEALFDSSELSEANLSEADLSRANLHGGYLHYTNLRRTILLGTRLDEAELWEVNLSRANLSSAQIRLTSLYPAQVTGVNLLGADLSESCTDWSRWRGVDLASCKGLETVRDLEQEGREDPCNHGGGYLEIEQNGQTLRFTTEVLSIVAPDEPDWEWRLLEIRERPHVEKQVVERARTCIEKVKEKSTQSMTAIRLHIYTFQRPCGKSSQNCAEQLLKEEGWQHLLAVAAGFDLLEEEAKGLVAISVWTSSGSICWTANGQASREKGLYRWPTQTEEDEPPPAAIGTLYDAVLNMLS